jgi:hypothetical protein
MILHGPLPLTRDTDSTEGLGFTCSPQGHGKAQAGDLQDLPAVGHPVDSQHSTDPTSASKDEVGDIH